METSLLKQMATIFFRAQNSIMNVTESLGSFQKLLVFLCWQRIEFTNFVQETFYKNSLVSFHFLFFLSFFFFPALKESTGIPDSDALWD